MFIAFVPTKSVFVRKNRQTFTSHKIKASSGRKAMLLHGSIEKEYDQIDRPPFVLRQVKPALWKVA